MTAAAEKLNDAGKKILIWLGAVFAGVIAALIAVGKRKVSDDDKGIKKIKDGNDEIEEINKKAKKKREEALSRIGSSSARDVAESYGAVCDAICDGKIRFRKRCESECGKEAAEK